MERPATNDYDESILRRAQPINFMLSDRYFRGPMVLPPRDEGRLGMLGDGGVVRNSNCSTFERACNAANLVENTGEEISDGRLGRYLGEHKQLSTDILFHA
jgi:hypothetical protein